MNYIQIDPEMKIRGCLKVWKKSFFVEVEPIIFFGL